MGESSTQRLGSTAVSTLSVCAVDGIRDPTIFWAVEPRSRVMSGAAAQ
jgi:hypothetical protein